MAAIALTDVHDRLLTLAQGGDPRAIDQFIEAQWPGEAGFFHRAAAWRVIYTAMLPDYDREDLNDEI